MTLSATSFSTDQGQISLTSKEVEQFHTDGFLGPFSICSPQEMIDQQDAVEEILASQPPDHDERQHNRHLDKRLIYDMAMHPHIVGRMASIMGPDLLLWRTNFFVKRKGDWEIPWHQDANYWPLEPAVICSAWLAVDETTTENACVQIVPGSHKKVLPHVKAADEMAFNEMADLHGVDIKKAVNIEMKPGEFILFNERTLHHSDANRSGMRRIGLAIRVIIPIVRVVRYDAPEHRLVVMSGEDRMGFNRLTDHVPEC